MSRAEAGALRVPSSPRFVGSLKAAASDFYFNSWRLVPANIIWGAMLLGLFGLGLVWPFGGLVLSPLLALPTVGLFRLAALITRAEPASFWDALRSWRERGLSALASGLVVAFATLALAINVGLGTSLGNAVGWAFATLAAWALLLTWAVALGFWCLLVDPRREDDSWREKLRLAGLLVVAFPFRLGLLIVAVTAILVVSTVAFAALLTISVAFVALLATRYLLPAADRLEGRATEAVFEQS